MIVMLRELVQEGSLVAVMPISISEREAVPLDDEDRTALSAFSGVAIEVDSRALPLQVFVSPDPAYRIIRPAKGGKILLGALEMTLKIGDRMLVLFQDPYPEEFQ